MIKFWFFQILLLVFVFVSCSDELSSTTKANGHEVTVICSCQSNEEIVQGKGSDQSAAEKSAQEKCNIIFPSVSIKDCKEVPQS